MLTPPDPSPSHPESPCPFWFRGYSWAHIPLLGDPMSHRLSDQSELQEGILALLLPPGRPGLPPRWQVAIRNPWKRGCTAHLPTVFYAWGVETSTALSPFQGHLWQLAAARVSENQDDLGIPCSTDSFSVFPVPHGFTSLFSLYLHVTSQLIS